MTSLDFPDVNVWLALIMPYHTHRLPARAWWKAAQSKIAFTRFTQISVLRLLTTTGAMNGKPLGMSEAWLAYDRLFEDSRVMLAPEPEEAEARFRKYTTGQVASPKLWADAGLLAFAQESGGTVVTFDQALAARAGADGLLLA